MIGEKGSGVGLEEKGESEEGEGEEEEGGGGESRVHNDSFVYWSMK